MFMRSFARGCVVLHNNLAQLSKPGQDLASRSVPLLSYSSKTSLNKLPTVEIDPETGKKKKRKTEIIPKITLLHGDELNIATLEEAQKIAKRRDLKLVKIVDLDTKTERPVYKLMSGAEYHSEDLKQRERKKLEKQNSPYKGEKVLMIKQNISEHDLQVHINKILKWIGKQYEVRVVINGTIDNMQKAEEVYQFMDKHLKDQSRLLQKRTKGSDIKFQIIPPKETKSSSKDAEGGQGKNSGAQ